MRVLTITFNDLGISWGPAIHFIELWNNFLKVFPNSIVKGLSPTWMGKPPIIEPCFTLRSLRVPNVKLFRQVLYDIFIAAYILFNFRSYDILYIRLSHWHILQIAVLFLLRVPFVIEINGLAKEDSASAGSIWAFRHIVALQEKWLVSNAKLCIAVSDGIAHSILKRYFIKGSVITIKNGVSKKFFNTAILRSSPKKKIIAIYVGTFTPWDGARDVLLLAQKYPEVDFLMVGDGPARARMESEATPNVIFRGYVNHLSLPAIYRSADCAIVLYEFERHKNVKLSSLKTLEYVASGLPVFTTAVPGQEYVEELGVGMLVKESQDIVTAFDQFLTRLSEYYQAYVKCHDLIQQQISWEATAQKTAEILMRLTP